MPLEDFTKTMNRLMKEFEDSGLSIDDFVKQKLTEAGHSDAAEMVKSIDGTLSSIDERYASLQKFKEEGGNREEWLRREVDNASVDIPSEKTGQVLSSAVKVLNGDEKAEPDETANYDGFDAPMLIHEIDDAIVNNTCKNLTDEQER